MKHRSRILCYSFDLQSCLCKYKRHACRVCGNALEKFAVKFAKNADLNWSKLHEWWCSAFYTFVSKQGRQSFSSLYIITLPYLMGKSCYRLALRPPVGPMHIVHYYMLHTYCLKGLLKHMCRGFAVRWCRNLQKRCQWKFNEQYIERDS